MAKKDSVQEMIGSGTKIGKHNAALWPEIKNWCRHIVLRDISAGLIATTGLPTNVQVSCPHADGSGSGMQLGWVAESFLEQNCPCQFHSPITSDNFGTKYFANKDAENKDADLRKQLETKAHQELTTQIETLVAGQKTKSETTELSILQLLDSLKDATKRDTEVEKVYEASKLSPQFFPLLSLDVLSLYYDDELAGGLCLLATAEVLRVKTERPSSVYAQVRKVILTGKHFDEAANLLPLFLTGDNISTEGNTIVALIERLQFERFPGNGFHEEENYPLSISALHDLIRKDSPFLLSIFRKELQVDNKSVRIDRNGCLQRLLGMNAAFVRELLPELIQSLELSDDAYLDSADYATCTTLANLIKTDPIGLYPTIRNRINLLSPLARKEGLCLYSILLTDKEFIAAHPTFRDNLIDELHQHLMKKGEDEEVHEGIVDELERLAHDDAGLLTPYFDRLLKYCSQLMDDQKTFNWYKEELEKKNREQITTFNPLRNLNPLEIHNKEIKNANELQNIKTILRKILKKESDAYGDTIAKAIGELDSKSQGKYKAELINLLWTSLQNPLAGAAQLPALYNFLLDMDSEEVRTEGLRFFERLIEKFPDLVTQTLLDLAELFLSDQDVRVRGMAISLQSAVARNLSERITASVIDTILRLMVDRFVFVHKTACRECIHFVPFMDGTRLLVAITHLTALIETYKETDEEFATELILDLLRITKERMPTLQKKIIQKYIIPYGQSEDYHTSTKFIELLCDIKNEYPEFEDNCVQIIIDWFRRVSPDYYRGATHERAAFYNELYTISYACIIRQLDLLETFLLERNERHNIDVIQILQLLAYFECNQSVVRCASSVLTRMERVRSNEWVFQKAEILKHFAQFELGVNEGNYSHTELKAITDALSSRES